MPRAGVQTREAWEDRPRLSREREEVIRILELPAGLAGELDPFVRDKYRELWQAAQIEEQE